MNLEVIQTKGLTKLSVKDIKRLKNENCILLDTRTATTFTQGFIPESISIGLEGRFAEWACALLPFHEKIALITEPGMEEDSIIRLSRVGFDQLIGYLDGGFEAWKTSGEPVDIIIDIEADEMKMDINYDPRMVIVDVRKELEFENGHVQTAVNIPLNNMMDVSSLSNFEDNDNIYVHCAGGYRSVIASSLMKRQGIHNLRNVLGGYEQIKSIDGMPLVAAKDVLN